MKNGTSINAKSLGSFVKVIQYRGFRGLSLHIQNILFDLYLGVETANRHIGTEENHYVTTSQNSIKKSLTLALNYVSRHNQINDVTLIEISAGKGKVVLLANEIFCRKFKYDLNILAIEVNDFITKILSKNLVTPIINKA